MNGSDILVLLNLGTVSTVDWQIVGCQRDAAFEETSDTIDQSCKTRRSQSVIPGRYSHSISLDFLYVENRADYMALKNANRQGYKVILARQESGVILQRVTAKIDSLSEAFPDQAEAVVSAAFTADGFITDLWIIGDGVVGSAFVG